MAKTRVTAMIDSKVLRDIDKMAKKLKRSRSQMVENMCESYLQDTKMASAAFTDPAMLELIMKVFGNEDSMRTVLRAAGAEFDEQKFQKTRGLFAKVVGGEE